MLIFQGEIPLSSEREFRSQCQPRRTTAGLFHPAIAFRPAAVIRSQVTLMRRRPAIVL
jgi:hypothetical protein